MAGAQEIGIPRNPDYNGARQEGISYVQRTAHRRRRVSTARAFLNPAKSRANLTLHTNAHATRILLDGKRAVGVEYAKGGAGGQTVEVRANREVILSGGAINSPQLLQLSGIGPAGLLQSLGIEVAHEIVGLHVRQHESDQLGFLERPTDARKPGCHHGVYLGASQERQYFVEVPCAGPGYPSAFLQAAQQRRQLTQLGVAQLVKGEQSAFSIDEPYVQTLGVA